MVKYFLCLRLNKMHLATHRIHSIENGAEIRHFSENHWKAATLKCTQQNKISKPGYYNKQSMPAEIKTVVLDL